MIRKLYPPVEGLYVVYCSMLSQTIGQTRK
jgi:hypothetical protein